MLTNKNDFHLAVILQNIHDERLRVENMNAHDLNNFILETQNKIQKKKNPGYFSQINFLLFDSHEPIEKRKQETKDLESILNFAINCKTRRGQPPQHATSTSKSYK